MNKAQNLKTRAAKLKKEMTAFHYAYQDPRTGLLPKIIILTALGYALSPVDLIPDFIPVIGYLDDLLILPALVCLALKTIPKAVMAEAREKAEKEPLTLRKNWFAAGLFILIWVAVLVAIIKVTFSL